MRTCLAGVFDYVLDPSVLCYVLYVRPYESTHNHILLPLIEAYWVYTHPRVHKYPPMSKQMGHLTPECCRAGNQKESITVCTGIKILLLYSDVAFYNWFVKVSLENITLKSWEFYRTQKEIKIYNYKMFQKRWKCLFLCMKIYRSFSFR